MTETEGRKVGVHKTTCNAELFRQMKAENVVDTTSNIIQAIKAVKNATEQEGMRQANLRDCAALIKYLAYLENSLKKEDHGIDEYTDWKYLCFGGM